MEENITIQDFVNNAVALNLVRGVKMEVYAWDKKFIVALYDYSNRREPVQGSWVLNETDAMCKIKDIQRKHGKECTDGKA